MAFKGGKGFGPPPGKGFGPPPGAFGKGFDKGGKFDKGFFKGGPPMDKGGKGKDMGKGDKGPMPPQMKGSGGPPLPVPQHGAPPLSAQQAPVGDHRGVEALPSYEYGKGERHLLDVMQRHRHRAPIPCDLHVVKANWAEKSGAFPDADTLTRMLLPADALSELELGASISTRVVVAGTQPGADGRIEVQQDTAAAVLSEESTERVGVILLCPDTGSNKCVNHRLRLVIGSRPTGKDNKGLFLLGGAVAKKDGKGMAGWKKAAIRHILTLTGVDLAGVKTWSHFADFSYKGEGADKATHILLPKTWDLAEDLPGLKRICKVGEETYDDIVSKEVEEEVQEETPCTMEVDEEVEDDTVKEEEKAVEEKKEGEEEEKKEGEQAEPEAKRRKTVTRQVAMSKFLPKTVKKTVKETVQKTREKEDVFFRPRVSTLQQLVNHKEAAAGPRGFELGASVDMVTEAVGRACGERVLNLLREEVGKREAAGEVKEQRDAAIKQLLEEKREALKAAEPSATGDADEGLTEEEKKAKAVEAKETITKEYADKVKAVQDEWAPKIAELQNPPAETHKRTPDQAKALVFSIADQHADRDGRVSGTFGRAKMDAVLGGLAEVLSEKQLVDLYSVIPKGGFQGYRFGEFTVRFVEKPKEEKKEEKEEEDPAAKADIGEAITSPDA